MIRELALSPTKTLCETKVHKIIYDSVLDRFQATLVSTNSRDASEATIVSVNNIVVATGRFGPEMSSMIDLELLTVFRRLEYGVRLVVEATNTFFDLPGIAKLADPKILLSLDGKDSKIQWRSFCCCREGEILETRFGNISTFSGRADSEPSQISNIGFNTRVSDAAIAKTMLADVSSLPAAFRQPLRAVLDGSAQLPYSQEASFWMIEGFKRLLAEYPQLAPADVVGPTLEGIGSYLDHDGNLRVKSRLRESLPIWVCGDSCGSFRGLVPAMVSGDYVGRMIAADIIKLKT